MSTRVNPINLLTQNALARAVTNSGLANILLTPVSFFGSPMSGDTNMAGTTSWHYLDSPNTTSAITYKVQVYTNGDVYINRPTVAADNYSVGSAHSSMTVMEIKQ